jgi:3-phosphoshikimate 1-carboxyvinyltransferase
MEISGTIEAPLSKSSQQRAIACSTMALGESTITKGTLSADSKAALRLARALGAKVSIDEALLRIEGSQRFYIVNNIHSEVDNVDKMLKLDCGESGLCTRMFSPIAALLDTPVIMTGQGSLLARPMAMVAEPLNAMGVSSASSDGRLPLRIHGPLHGGDFDIDASESSQFLTGVLMALPLAAGNSVVRVNHAVSRGYIDLTIETCAAFGVRIKKDSDYSHFIIQGSQRYNATDFIVEGDWSSGAFLVVAAAIAAKKKELSILGLRQNSSQPDKAIVAAVKSAGAGVEESESGLCVHSLFLRAFEFDATDCPDLFPPLAVLAATCEGRSRLSGIHRLRGKESDRATTIKAMLNSVGIEASLDGDDLVIRGGAISGGKVDSAGDHRIAMAAAVLALAASAPVSIGGAECVSKSWPGFFEDLESVQIDVSHSTGYSR